jgi:hypothetical protein
MPSAAGSRIPFSAQYRWPDMPARAKAGDTQAAYCFLVNGKNSFSGYTGFKLIVGKVALSKGRIVAFDYGAGLLDDTPLLAQATAQICRTLGFAL